MREVEHEPLGGSLCDALEPVEIEQPVAVLEVEEDRRVGDVRPRSRRQLDRRGRDRQSHRQRQPRRPAGQRHRRQPAAALGERTDEIVERARGEVAARPDDSRRSAGVEREQVARRAARGGEVERVGHGRQGGRRAERAVARAEVDRRRRASPLARIDEYVRAGGVRGLIDLRAVPGLAVGRGEHADRDREHEQQDRAGVAARPAGDLAEAQRSDDAPGPAHQPLDERGDERHQPQREQGARDQEQGRRGDQEGVDPEPAALVDQHAVVVPELPVADQGERDEDQVEPHPLCKAGDVEPATVTRDHDAARAQRGQRQAGDADRPCCGGERVRGRRHLRVEAQPDVRERPDPVEDVQPRGGQPRGDDHRRDRDQRRLDEGHPHDLPGAGAAQAEALGRDQAPLEQQGGREEQPVQRQQRDLDRGDEHACAGGVERVGRGGEDPRQPRLDRDLLARAAPLVEPAGQPL